MHGWTVVRASCCALVRFHHEIWGHHPRNSHVYCGWNDVRLILGGMVAGVPGHGGATWAALQYALGLRALGHEVLLADEVHGPGDPDARERYLRDVSTAFGMEGRVALLTGNRSSLGIPFA